MLDQSRFVARWFSSHDFIGAYINDRTKYKIYNWITLGTDQTFKRQIWENNSKF